LKCIWNLGVLLKLKKVIIVIGANMAGQVTSRGYRMSEQPVVGSLADKNIQTTTRSGIELFSDMELVGHVEYFEL
jgi:hypothetical protein